MASFRLTLNILKSDQECLSTLKNWYQSSCSNEIICINYETIKNSKIRIETEWG